MSKAVYDIRKYTREELDAIADAGGLVGPVWGTENAEINQADVVNGYRFRWIDRHGTGNCGRVILIPERVREGRLTPAGRRAAKRLSEARRRAIQQEYACTKEEAAALDWAAGRASWGRENLPKWAHTALAMRRADFRPDSARLLKMVQQDPMAGWGPRVRRAAAELGIETEGMSVPRLSGMVEGVIYTCTWRRK